MKDINELTITESEFEELTGLWSGNLEQPKKQVYEFNFSEFWSFIDSSKDFPLLNFCFIVNSISLLCTSIYIIQEWRKSNLLGAFLLFIINLVLESFLIRYILKILKSIKMKEYRDEYQSYMELEGVKHLHSDVQKYNEVIRGIGINDELISVGTVLSSPKDRKKVVKALTLVRQDLVRALKTERILRENKDFIALNPSMFDSNLSTVESLRISDEAVEWSKLFNQAIEVAVEVNSEMRKLQNQNDR